MEEGGGREEEKPSGGRDGEGLVGRQDACGVRVYENLAKRCDMTRKLSGNWGCRLLEEL